MAVINTGIVERTIVGVNESDLFLDSEATSVTTNTGIVERSIVGVHDANFVHPIGDEEITNGDFSNGSTDWLLGYSGTGDWNVTDKLNFTNVNGGSRQSNVFVIGKTYKITLDYTFTSGTRLILPYDGSNFNSDMRVNAPSSAIGYTYYYTPLSNTSLNIYSDGNGNGSIDNVSVKEMLVNRESTTTNTGVVERAITGLNESELWLDAESTSVVNNTGIIERPITGVNESDPMFPDNTISNIVNIAGIISSLIADLKARATTFENEEATQNILINLQKC